MAGIRYDRAASLYLFQPVNRCLRRESAGVPILMYHRVPQADDCTTHPYYCMSTTTRAFAAQMRFLHENGYHTVSVMETYRHALTASPGRKPVAITFDDGYRDFYTNAFPILNRYGYSATMFLPTAYIGDGSQRFKGAECLTWGEVWELHRAGIEFGSHTVTHPQLHDVSREQLRREIRDSKQQIEGKLGVAVDAFSYPYAFPETNKQFVLNLHAELQANGYSVGVSTIIGRMTSSGNPFFMRRLPVNSHDDSRLLRAKLEGGYDWLHAVQFGAKLKVARPHFFRR